MDNLKGIIPALLTPFFPDNSINHPVLRKLVRLNLEKSVPAFYVGGSTAEAFLLSTDVRKAILDTFVDEVAGRQDMHNYWLQKMLNQTEETCIMPGETWACGFDLEEVMMNCPQAQDIVTYYTENCLRFITGERNLAEFDDFIDELYDIGLQGWIDEYTRQWNECPASHE